MARRTKQSIATEEAVIQILKLSGIKYTTTKSEDSELTINFNPTVKKKKTGTKPTKKKVTKKAAVKKTTAPAQKKTTKKKASKKKAAKKATPVK